MNPQQTRERLQEQRDALREAETLVEKRLTLLKFINQHQGQEITCLTCKKTDGQRRIFRFRNLSGSRKRNDGSQVDLVSGGVVSVVEILATGLNQVRGVYLDGVVYIRCGDDMLFF